MIADKIDGCLTSVTSIDIMTLMTVMIRIEKTNSFLAQIRLSTVVNPVQATYSQNSPIVTATTRKPKPA